MVKKQRVRRVFQCRQQPPGQILEVAGGQETE
jgi:hypothetical protein